MTVVICQWFTILSSILLPLLLPGGLVSQDYGLLGFNVLFTLPVLVVGVYHLSKERDNIIDYNSRMAFYTEIVLVFYNVYKQNILLNDLSFILTTPKFDFAFKIISLTILAFSFCIRIASAVFLSYIVYKNFRKLKE